MKNKLQKMFIAAFCMMAAFSASYVHAAAAAVDPELKSQVNQTLAQFEQADPSMTQLLNQSAGYAVFPNVGKGGLIVGGAHGKGLVFQQGKIIGEASMTQATIGAQAGGQTFSELVVFQDSNALREFKSGNFKMRAEAGAVAATEGAAKVAKFDQGIAVFTMGQKGLMVQAAVGGQKFHFRPLE